MKVDKGTYGKIMWDMLESGESKPVIIERDDGLIDLSWESKEYVAPFEKWPGFEKEAVKFAQGRTLDIGCGVGRVCIYLQKKGHDVVGIDVDPTMIKTARKFGVKNTRVMPITQVSRARLGEFETIVMFGHNWGLLGNSRRAKWLLKRFRGMTSSRGRILASTLDPYKTNDQVHLNYQKRNRARGRMGGQIRLRVRYRELASPWLDYLFVSEKEMREILKETGWKISKVFTAATGPSYAVLIEKNC